MGKSTCAEMLRPRSVPVVDTDALARELVEPGQPALEEIRRTFGPEAVDSAGKLRRDFLAERVFSDQSARQRLEAILHPRIRALWQTQVAHWREEGRPVGVVVIPLLFETNAQREFDMIICVACSKATQDQRLLARGWTPQQIEQRINAQWPIDQKIAAANFVVWTEGSQETAAEQLDRILQYLGSYSPVSGSKWNSASDAQGPFA